MYCTCNQFLEISTEAASVALDNESGEEDDKRDRESQKFHTNWL